MRPHPMIAGYWLAAAIWVGAILVGLVPASGDAMNFYDHLANPYAVHDYASGAGFYYAPPVALAMQALSVLGRQAFMAVMVALGLAAVGWIGGRWAFLLLFFPPVWWDISAGNVNTVIGAAIVASLVRPGWIVVPALTKVTPAITGLWWVVRGEWRQIARALVVGAVIVVPTLIRPDLWIGWLSGLISNGTGYTGPGYFTVPVPLLPRLVLALVVVAWAAKKDRPRLLPIAGMLAVPVLWWSALAIGVAAIRRVEPLSQTRGLDSDSPSGWRTVVDAIVRRQPVQGRRPPRTHALVLAGRALVHVRSRVPGALVRRPSGPR